MSTEPETAIADPVMESLKRLEKTIAAITPERRKEMEEQRLKAEEAKRASERHELRIKSGAPHRHLAQRDLCGKEWMEAREKLLSKLGKGCLIALMGIRGNGKTQLAVEAMEKVIADLKGPRFVLAMDIFLEIRGSYRKDSKRSEGQVIESFCEPPLLVIDEIQERGETPFEDRMLTHIINKRYQEMRDTILIGNVTAEVFQKEMNPSIISRLGETGGVIECTWESFR